MSTTPSPRPRGRAERSPSPRPLSERKLAANRANAQKSTGPRTAAGKARSRLNALRHGATAAVGLLPGEDGRALRALSAAVYAEFRPRGQAEAVLVDQYVSIAWKLRRLGAAERQVAAEQFGRDMGQFFDDRDDHAWALRNERFREEAEAFGPPEPPDGKSAAELVYQDLFNGTGPLLRLMDLEMRLRGTLTAVVKQLKDVRALRRQQAADDRAAEEEGGDGHAAGPWEAGEWDADPTRFGTYFDDDEADGGSADDDGGDEEGEEEEEEDQEGEEDQEHGEAARPPAPAAPLATRGDDSTPAAQNQPTAAAGASPGNHAAQAQAAAPDARPAASDGNRPSGPVGAANRPTEATASGPALANPGPHGTAAAAAAPLVTPPLPTAGPGGRSINRGT
jgi:hypothetical protein